MLILLSVKKWAIRLLILSIIFGGIYIYISYNTNIKNNENVDKTKENQATLIDNLVTRLGLYKKQESEEKIRQTELQQLQDPTLIKGECKRKGELLVYEGVMSYVDLIKEDTMFTTKSLSLNLKYNFGIVFDLRKIQIDGFHGKTVFINIPQDELVLMYVELMTDTPNTSVKSDVSLFASQYSPEEMKSILDNASISTRKNINMNKDIFQEAKYGLEDILKDLILKLKYEKVVFQYIKN
jgi:hypothetical protein